MNQENVLSINKHILLCVDDEINLDYPTSMEYEFVKQKFCGNVYVDVKSFNDSEYTIDSNIYLCGDIEHIMKNINVKFDNKIFVIKDISDHEYVGKYDIVSLGQVPINIGGVGVYFRNLFDSHTDYFDRICNEHKFQELTESNKLSSAFRSGIYLTNVEEDTNGDIKFNLLRCSSNLSGSTDNFREIDKYVISNVNDVAKQFFETNTNLNHVLAQIYNNSMQDGKEKKAKIKRHSDKTKDMPKNGLMAFCTFYKNYSDNKFNLDDEHLNELKKSEFEYNIGNMSIFTKLRFKLKNPSEHPTLLHNFDVILYPNSVFLMSLTTNRLYTHEIVPSGLNISNMPTRMGYVVRCSNMHAIFRNNQTYILNNENEYVKLEDPTDDQIKELKDVYLMENSTDSMISYGKINFSLNGGDYLKPIV